MDTGAVAKKSRVQSVVLSKSRFKTVEAARAWVEHEGEGRLKHGKVDETEGSFRFRQFDPDQCNGVMRSQSVSNGVTFVLCVEELAD